MKTTLALYWKSLVAKIHPPLPMSPRDSQKLLSVLNVSFRKQLESDHTTNHHKGEASADHHLESILTNPLFLANMSLPTISTAKSPRRDSMSVREIHHALGSPTDAFRQRISAGTADLDTAKICLNLQLKMCRASSSAELRQSLENSRAGSIVLSWLWSSGLARSGIFMMDTEFIRLLSKFVAAEKKHQFALEWIRLLGSQPPGDKTCDLDKAIQKMQSYIALQMLRAEVEYGSGIGSATRLFVDWLKSRSHLPLQLFVPAGRYLTATVSKTLNAENNNEGFDSFINSIQSWSDPSSFEYAWQGVHHPKQPNAEHALGYLQRMSPQSASTTNATQRLSTVLMGLKAADLLLSEGDQSGAIRIMDFLQLHFSSELGVQEKKIQAGNSSSDKHKREDTSVRLLESLAVH